LLLATEVMIAEAPEEKKVHAHGAPGGMGGMDIRSLKARYGLTFTSTGR
jgi:hypothetical protein